MERLKLALPLVLFFLIPAVAGAADQAGEPAGTSFGWLSVLPPLIAIALALITRDVLIFLFVGVVSGAFIYTG